MTCPPSPALGTGLGGLRAYPQQRPRTKARHKRVTNFRNRASFAQQAVPETHSHRDWQGDAISITRVKDTARENPASASYERQLRSRHR